MTKKLLKALPVKYHKYVRELEEEGGLCDDMKYMLYLEDDEDAISYPVASIREAVQFTKDFAKASELTKE